jgi:hypothetical protein
VAPFLHGAKRAQSNCGSWRICNCLETTKPPHHCVAVVTDIGVIGDIGTVTTVSLSSVICHHLSPLSPLCHRCPHCVTTVAITTATTVTTHTVPSTVMGKVKLKNEFMSISTLMRDFLQISFFAENYDNS